MTKKKIDTVKSDEQPQQSERGVGRPPFEITEEVIAQAETLAAQGMTTQQIALALGMGETTIYEKQRAYPEFAQAIKSGKAKGIAIVTEKLLEKAMNMDTTAMLFYLKCQAGWRDTQSVEMTGADGKPLLPALTVQFVDSTPEAEPEGGAA